MDSKKTSKVNMIEDGRLSFRVLSHYRRTNHTWEMNLGSMLHHRQPLQSLTIVQVLISFTLPFL